MISFTMKKLYLAEYSSIYLFLLLLPSSEDTVAKNAAKTSAYVSSGSLMVSGLTFKPLIHFSFIFLNGVGKWSIFIFSHVTGQFCNTH